jgi:hypothetical protein
MVNGCLSEEEGEEEGEEEEEEEEEEWEFLVHIAIFCIRYCWF